MWQGGGGGKNLGPQDVIKRPGDGAYLKGKGQQFWQDGGGGKDLFSIINIKACRVRDQGGRCGREGRG